MLFLGHTGSEADFSGLSRLSELEEPALDVKSATQDTEKLDAFRELPKLREVTFSCGQGTPPLHAFPAVTEPTALGETTEMGGGSSELRILTATGEDAPALGRLSVFAFDMMHFKGYRSTVLRELCLDSCGIDSLAFTGALPSLELLNISNNRVEDITPLTALPKLRYFCYTDNVTRNIGLLKDRGTVPVK